MTTSPTLSRMYTSANAAPDIISPSVLLLLSPNDDTSQKPVISHNVMTPNSPTFGSDLRTTTPINVHSRPFEPPEEEERNVSKLA